MNKSTLILILVLLLLTSCTIHSPEEPIRDDSEKISSESIAENTDSLFYEDKPNIGDYSSLKQSKEDALINYDLNLLDALQSCDFIEISSMDGTTGSRSDSTDLEAISRLIDEMTNCEYSVINPAKWYGYDYVIILTTADLREHQLYSSGMFYLYDDIIQLELDEVIFMEFYNEISINNAKE